VQQAAVARQAAALTVDDLSEISGTVWWCQSLEGAILRLPILISAALCTVSVCPLHELTVSLSYRNDLELNGAPRVLLHQQSMRRQYLHALLMR